MGGNSMQQFFFFYNYKTNKAKSCTKNKALNLKKIKFPKYVVTKHAHKLPVSLQRKMLHHAKKKE
jgi:hypothetical protein